MKIRAFNSDDEEAVIVLWRACDLTRPWNDPKKDIERKLAVQPELFLVGERDGEVVATVMAGYDGHRGWINYLAVRPDLRRSGLGAAIMGEVERRLVARGAPKINLQIRSSNKDVVAFYRQLGYATDDVVSMGKRLVDDEAINR
ncbi:MAG: GNAT family acetyltransferase [Candidatus Hydrogenedentes bacterium]|nr:GNAT family acetyltransferase [Candidatus Hydrogenedentota bacterium]